MSYYIYIERNGKEECMHGYGTWMDIFDIVKFMWRKARIKRIKTSKNNRKQANRKEWNVTEMN